jgi:hypothetical protein
MFDECTSKPELIKDFISFAWALHEPPVTHNLLMSHSESNICKVFQNEEVHKLVRWQMFYCGIYDDEVYC